MSHGFGAVLSPELLEDVFKMIFNCVGADGKLFGESSVRETLAHKFKQFAFARGQVLG